MMFLPLIDDSTEDLHMMSDKTHPVDLPKDILEDGVQMDCLEQTGLSNSGLNWLKYI